MCSRDDLGAADEAGPSKEILCDRCQAGLPKDLLCFSMALSVQKALGIEADCLFSPCVPRW